MQEVGDWDVVLARGGTANYFDGDDLVVVCTIHKRAILRVRLDPAEAEPVGSIVSGDIEQEEADEES